MRFHVQSASYAISYVCAVNVRICQALGNHGFSSTLGDVPRESAGVEALPGPEDRDGRAGRDSARDAPQPTHAAANKTTSEVGGCSIEAAIKCENVAVHIKLHLEHPLTCRLCWGPFARMMRSWTLSYVTMICVIAGCVLVTLYYDDSTDDEPVLD